MSRIVETSRRRGSAKRSLGRRLQRPSGVCVVEDEHRFQSSRFDSEKAVEQDKRRMK
jgi:hypothetical protein